MNNRDRDGTQKPRVVQSVNDQPDINLKDLKFIGKMKFSIQVGGLGTVYMTIDPSDSFGNLVYSTTDSPDAVFAAYSVNGACVFQQMNLLLRQKMGNAPLFIAFAPTGALGKLVYLPLLLGFVTIVTDPMAPHQFSIPGLSLETTSIALWDNNIAGVQNIMGQDYNLGTVSVGEGQFMLFPQEQPGVQAWTVQVLTPAPPDMNGADFNYTILHNYALTDVSLRGAQFIDADLSGSQLVGCDLTGANLTGADLTGAQWSNLNITPTNLTNAELSNANLSDANFQGCVMAGADFTGAVFSSATNFAGADLSNAKFSPGVNLQGVNFADAILNGANLTGANLTGAKFSRSVTAASAILSKAILKGDDLSGIDFTDAKLDGADLTGVLLHDANLNDATLAGATAANTDFTSTTTGTQLIGTDFTGVDLTTANFDAVPHFSNDSTKLTKFNQATLNYKVIGTNWSYLDLSNATVVDLPAILSTATQPLAAQYAIIASLNASSGQLSNKTLQSADFSYAVLNGVDLSKSDLTQAKFDHGNLPGVTLAGAILENISAVGTQFGGLDVLFSAPNAQTALNAGDISTLAPLFEAHGITLSPNATVTKTRGLWRVSDPVYSQGYVVTKETPSSAGVITVYCATPFTVDLKAYPNCEADLDSGPNQDLVKIFAHYDLTLSMQATITLETATWTIDDEKNNSGSYTARKDTEANGDTTLNVYASSSTASFSSAFFSGAKLTGAVLFGASGGQSDFYGGGTTLEGVILEDASFDGVNLSQADLRQVQMQGITLDGAFLVNTKLGGAVLTRATTGKLSSLTFAYLAGADFEDALAYDADFSNAGVAVSIGDPSDGLSGVYLFQLPTGVKALLNQAAKRFSLNPNEDLGLFGTFLQALDAGILSALLPVFEKHGITLSSSAKIAAVNSTGKKKVWQIVENSSVSYSVWTSGEPSSLEAYGTAGTFSLNPGGDPDTYSALVTALNNQNLSPLQQAFNGQGHPIDDSTKIESSGQTGPWMLSSTTDGSPVYTVSSGQDANGKNELYVVPEFSLNPSGDSTNYAALIAALQNRDLATLQAAFVKQNYTLASDVQIAPASVQWTISDLDAVYVAWIRLDADGDPGIYVQPALDNLIAAFKVTGYTLQPFAKITTNGNSGWFVDNDQENPEVVQSGYVALQIQDLSPKPLDVYGTTIRMQRTRPNGTRQQDDFECQLTNLKPENMGPGTTCPNEQSLATNRANGKTMWNDWMRATKFSNAGGMRKT